MDDFFHRQLAVCADVPNLPDGTISDGTIVGRRMKTACAIIAAAIVGIGTWLGIGAWSGVREAWDSPLYWSVGMPLMSACAFAIAALVPERPWRWGIVVMFASGLCGLVQAFPNITLWPLSLVIIFVMSLPMVAAAYLGAVAHRFFRPRRG